MKKVIVCLSCFLFLVCGCAKTTIEEVEEDVTLNENIVEEIQDRGYLMVGCKMDVPELSYYDEESDTWSGLEVELAYKSAANVFGVSVDEAKEQQLVHFVGVTVANREEKLENGEVDCLFSTYTITSQRKKKFEFSNSYYKDYIGLMVLKSVTDSDSLGSKGIHSISDLDGKIIGVPRNATTRKDFLKYIDTMESLDINPIFNEYTSYNGLYKALKSKEIDVMAVDVSILKGYVDSSTKILDDRFAGQNYGAAIQKQNHLLMEYINQAIQE